jgi:hypothetical protein
MNSSAAGGNIDWNPQNLTRTGLQQDDFLLSDVNFKGEKQCDDSLDKIFWVVDAFIGACILAGNSFTITVFIFGGQLHRSHMNAFLLSLAVSDIILALIVIPSYAAYCTGCTLTLTNLCWFFEGGKDYTFLASVFNLLAISYDRHIAVFRPLLYNLHMTEKRVICILISTWILPGILAGLRNAWQHAGPPDEVEKMNNTYTYFLFFAFVVVPIIVVCIINVRIMHAIKIQVRKIRGTATSLKTAGSAFVSHAQEDDALRRKRGTLSCVLVVAIFVVCWLPRGTYFMLRLFQRLDLAGPVLVKLSITFLLFQSSLNPIIYSFFRAEFRHTAKRLLFSLRIKLAKLFR